MESNGVDSIRTETANAFPNLFVCPRARAPMCVCVYLQIIMKRERDRDVDEKCGTHAVDKSERLNERMRAWKT